MVIEQKVEVINTNSNKIERRKGTEKYIEENNVNIPISQSKESKIDTVYN